METTTVVKRNKEILELAKKIYEAGIRSADNDGKDDLDINSSADLISEYINKISRNKFEYFIQKHDIAPTKLMENNYDEDDDELLNQLNNMGEYSWELCGIIRHKSDDNNAKFLYKRKLIK